MMTAEEFNAKYQPGDPVTGFGAWWLANFAKLGSDVRANAKLVWDAAIAEIELEQREHEKNIALAKYEALDFDSDGTYC